MSTSSGSRVRRLGTMAMSSKPYARRPVFPSPISTSATQPVPSCADVGPSLLGGPERSGRWTRPRRAHAVAKRLEDLAGDRRVHLVGERVAGVASLLDHAAPGHLLDRVQSVDERLLGGVGGLVAEVGQGPHDL